MWWLWTLLGFLGLVCVVGIHDLVQRENAVLRNFPVVGHVRHLLSSVGPKLRQYIVAANDEERPFTRDERSWIERSSRKENNYFGFGTDNDVELSPNYLIVKHAAFPLDDPQPGQEGHDPDHRLPCARVLGEARGREKAFRPASVINISGMSFGSLSAAAIEALNRGAAHCGCLHNTGEGGVSPYHRHGGDLIWQIGTAYFGCRTDEGTFDEAEFLETCEATRVKAIEIKLSQGAKPGVGGLLPGKKVTPEIAEIRGIPAGEDCVSPPSHAAFDDADGLLDFAEHIAEKTGLPVGIKSAVGEMAFWEELARLMAETDRGLDFITVDGGEGGTGAGPLVFTDHVAFPFKMAFARVRKTFVRHGVADQVCFVGSGKLGFPEKALFAFALGCDLIQVGREAMMAVGCIQAQKCHTGHCPTGVATQSPWLMRGLDPTSKAARLANYVTTLRKELLRLTRACGQPHPALVGLDRLELVDDRFGSETVRERFGYEEGWDVPPAGEREAIRAMMAELPANASTSD